MTHRAQPYIAALFASAAVSCAQGQSCNAGSCHWLYLDTSVTAFRSPSTTVIDSRSPFYDCTSLFVSNSAMATTPPGSSMAYAAVSENFASYGVLRQSGLIAGTCSFGNPGVSSGISGGTGIDAIFKDTVTVSYPGAPPGATLPVKVTVQTAAAPAYGRVGGTVSLGNDILQVTTANILPSGKFPMGGTYSFTTHLLPGSHILSASINTFSGNSSDGNNHPNYSGGTTGAMRISIELLGGLGSIDLCSNATYLPCLADLDFDGDIDDADFGVFQSGYVLLDCPLDQNGNPIIGCLGDINGDGVVDDSDFERFVIAYNELVCP